MIPLAQQQDRDAVLSRCEAEFGGHLRGGKEEKEKEEERRRRRKKGGGGGRDERNCFSMRSYFILFTKQFSVGTMCVNASSVFYSTIDCTLYVFAALTDIKRKVTVARRLLSHSQAGGPGYEVWERG